MDFGNPSYLNYGSSYEDADAHVEPGAPFPVEQIGAKATELEMTGGARVYHLPDWHKLSHPERLGVIRQIALARGRDPRIAKLAIDIIRRRGIKPRQYQKQAEALLKWVQNPKNFYYTNEPGERLQDPIYTLRAKTGDCFAEGTLVLRDDFALIPIQDIKAGEKIWGRDRWSQVVSTMQKGVLPVTHVRLSNGSTLRLTEDHKVYVWSCGGVEAESRTRAVHGPGCRAKNWEQCVGTYGKKLIRIHVSELQPGMEILRPEAIEQTAQGDAEESWFIGAYVADGWKEEYRVGMSGLDGNWKEATKVRAQRFADSRGWGTRCDRRYLSIHGRAVVDLVSDCGGTALTKQIPEKFLRFGDAAALDEGLRLDASENSQGSGWTFGTVSRKLAIQYRVLQRIQGRNTSIKEVKDHGGFGENPIYRVTVTPKAAERATTRKPPALCVREVIRAVEQVPTYDISTDDHYVYLPEADCTVSNCDDAALLLCSLFESIRLPWKLVLSGRSNDGRKVRYIEGDHVPRNAAWSHIYCMVGTPPFAPSEWWFAEPTIEGVPLGWDVINGDKAYLPEMGPAYSGPARINPAPPAPFAFLGRRRTSNSPAVREALGDMAPGALSMAAGMAAADETDSLSGKDLKRVMLGIVTGVGVAVGTQLVLGLIGFRK